MSIVKKKKEMSEDDAEINIFKWISGLCLEIECQVESDNEKSFKIDFEWLVMASKVSTTAEKNGKLCVLTRSLLIDTVSYRK